MNLSKQLISRIRAAMDEHQMTMMDLSRLAGISHTTVGRWFSGSAKKITDETAEQLSSALKIPLSEIMVLSIGGMPKPEELPARKMAVAETEEKYSADVWDDLARWGRSDRVPDKAKAHVLSAAELAGFTSGRLSGALHVLSTASSPEEENDAERCAAVA